MSFTEPKKHRRRMVTAIKKQIRHYEKCLPLLATLDTEIYATGQELFTDDVGLALWLCAPARALNGEIPLFVARTEAGRKQVLNILTALVHGGYL